PDGRHRTRFRRRIRRIRSVPDRRASGPARSARRHGRRGAARPDAVPRRPEADPPMNTPPEAAAALADHGPTRVADRGHTRIAERVIEKIAARAATDVERTGGAARQVLGVAVGRAGPAG